MLYCDPKSRTTTVSGWEAAFRLRVGVGSLCLTYLTARYLKVGGDF